jgi:DNA-directed RNA polymerase specialized sigma24 family protein/CheY-like chemotaxis protein
MESVMRNLSQQIISSLPHLRRYAHAVTGSQRYGDNRVRVVLEILLQNPDQMRSGKSPRVEIFRLFHSVLDRLASSFHGVDLGSAAEPHLLDAVARLSPRSRQILLLAVLARFEAEDIAEVLGIDRQIVTRRLQYARDRIQRRLSARILIIEDEDVVASEMGRAVENLGHTVVGIAHSDGKAVKLARSVSPELVLADARLRDGHEAAVEQIRSTTKAPIIFVRPSRRSGRAAGPRRAGGRRVDSDALQKTIMRALPWKSALRESLTGPLSAH